MRYSILTILTLSGIATLAFSFTKNNVTLHITYDANVVYEVWYSTNLVDWDYLTETPTESSLVVKSDKPAEFFKVRKKDLTTGGVSEWATK